jgi:hypothetical protein
MAHSTDSLVYLYMSCDTKPSISRQNGSVVTDSLAYLPMSCHTKPSIFLPTWLSGQYWLTCLPVHELRYQTVYFPAKMAQWSVMTHFPTCPELPYQTVHFPAKIAQWSVLTHLPTCPWVAIPNRPFSRQNGSVFQYWLTYLPMGCHTKPSIFPPKWLSVSELTHLPTCPWVAKTVPW